MAISTLTRKVAGLGTAAALVAGGLIVAAPADATPKAFTISGTIVDSATNAAVANDTVALVFLPDPTNPASATAVTDAGANVTAISDASGNYSLSFDLGGSFTHGVYIVTQTGLNQSSLTNLGYASGPVATYVLVPGAPNMVMTAAASPALLSATGTYADPNPEKIAKFATTGGAPVISGTAKLGNTLTADVSSVTWNGTPVASMVQWLSNGKPIANANKTTLKIGQAQAGTQISVVDVAIIGINYGGSILAPDYIPSAMSAMVAVPKAKTTVGVKVKSSKGGTITVTVTLTSGKTKLNGKVTVKVGKTSKKVVVKNGTGKATFKKLKKGKTSVKASFAKIGGLLASSKTTKVTIK
jgi:hypothetical protein